MSTTAPVSPFGRRLRYWRALRGLSQLNLAAAAGTTSRHVSFIETGRSRPGADLVTRLADVLAVPLRERNDLLAAAGLTPTGAVHSLDSPALQPVRDVLERVLRQHEPFPAWVIGRGLRFLVANRGAETLFPGVTGMSPKQVIDLWFGAGPYREQVVNWADVVRSTLITLRQELLVTGDGEVAALLRRAEELTRDLPVQVPEPGQDGGWAASGLPGPTGERSVGADDLDGDALRPRHRGDDVRAAGGVDVPRRRDVRSRPAPTGRRHTRSLSRAPGAHRFAISERALRR